jgi:hypothetical protein
MSLLACAAVEPRRVFEQARIMVLDALHLRGKRCGESGFVLIAAEAGEALLEGAVRAGVSGFEGEARANNRASRQPKWVPLLPVVVPRAYPRKA